MDARVKAVYDARPDRTARERAHAKAATRRNAAAITPEQRGFFHGLSAPVALAAAADASGLFFNSAVRAFAAGGFDTDVPISVGVVLSLGLSGFETFPQTTPLYFYF